MLSLCGGVETGLYALQQLDIPVKEYHTYEILPEAIAVSQYHFPFVIHHGDLYEADFNQFKGFDLLLAGTCCQSLSKVRIENKQVNNGLDGKSGIFFKAIECLKVIQPKYFMFENVIPSREEDLNTMTECIGVDPLLIDSAIFSAQSRERYYWTNIRMDGKIYHFMYGVLTRMSFGSNNNYAESSVRKYLKECKLAKDIKCKYGNSITPVENNLLSMDGFNDYGVVKDDVLSIPTFDLFRKCGEKLPLINYPHWLSTPNQTKSRKDSSCVQVVRSIGRVGCNDCLWFDYGVRPFFITES